MEHSEKCCSQSADDKGGCARMRAVHGYVAWILGSPEAAAIAQGLLWAAIPARVTALSTDVLRNMTCVPRHPPPPPHVVQELQGGWPTESGRVPSRPSAGPGPWLTPPCMERGTGGGQ